MQLQEIAHLVGGEIVGCADIEIKRLAKIEDAKAGDITFLSDPRYAKYLATTAASAILISGSAEMKELAERMAPITIVKVEDAYRAFVKLIDVFYPPLTPLPKGIHPTAVIAESVNIKGDSAIGPHVIIGERCTIGCGVSLYPGVVLGDDVTIEDETVVYANVTVYDRCSIGKRCIIHSGTVIGSDGFGFLPNPDGTYEKTPQRGSVVIEDDVEIGANCTIDRATIGETRIKRGAKLDNLIQVAHNVVIGENTVIAAQSGISGSTMLGKNCVIAGQVGFVGHIHIAERTTVGAQSGVSKSITEPGQTYFGYPAKEHLQALRVEGAIRQLPALLVEIRELKKRVETLEAHIKKPVLNG